MLFLDWPPQFEAAYRDLLSIRTEDDLTRILLRNAQYLRMRTSQVLPRGQQFYGGTALYFALFCDVAGRDEQTIEAFWASIARFWGAWYRRQDYYQQINQLRGVMGKAPANGLSEAHAVGVYSRVAVFQDESGQKGHSQVLLEQYLDFVVNRTFRQTLLVHASRSEQVRYRVQPERYQAFHFAAQLPCVQGSTRQDGSTQEYGVPGKATVNTSQSTVKLAMDQLTAAWPCTLAYADLLAGVRSGLHPALPEAQSQALLDDLLEHLVIRGLVKYHLTPVQLAEFSAQPTVDPQVRHMARLSQHEADASTFNQWHETVPLSVVERWLLPELDGSRDRQALADLLLTHAAQGRVSFLQQGQPVTGEAQLAAAALEHVDMMLSRLPLLKLLR